MLVKIPKGWEIPEREATPEGVYLNRRQLLLGAGFIGLEGLIKAATEGKKDVYPARRNPEFKLDRPITEEWAATSYNNFYEFTTNKANVKNLVGEFVTSPWKVEVTGLVNKPRTFDLDDLIDTMPLEERLYRHRCVEAWAMAVPWTGFPLSVLLKIVEPRPEAKYARFFSVNRPTQMPGIPSQSWYPWPYFEGLRLDEAMNNLALVVTGLYGKPLPKQNGAPIRIVTPWKYGYKSTKSIVKIELVKKEPPTFWNQLAPREYGFYSNVNPKKPHPRWSQATEKVIPKMNVVPTQPYNGYGEWVASMYNGKEV